MVYEREIWTGIDRSKNDSGVLQMRVLKERKPSDKTMEFDNKTPRFYFQPITETNIMKRKQKKTKNKIGVRLGPWHFPEGTVFKVHRHAAHLELGSGVKADTFTVDHLIQVSPKTWCISTKEKHTGIINQNVEEPYVYHIDHVEDIISLGTGKLRFDHELPDAHKEDDLPTFLKKNLVDVDKYFDSLWMEKPELKKGEHLFVHHHRFLNVIVQHFGIRPENRGKEINDGAFFRFMKTQNMGRVVMFMTDNGIGSILVINVKKMTKWLKKNQHRIFHSLKESEKKDRTIIDNAFKQLDDDDIDFP